MKHSSIAAIQAAIENDGRYDCHIVASREHMIVAASNGCSGVFGHHGVRLVGRNLNVILPRSIIDFHGGLIERFLDSGRRFSRVNEMINGTKADGSLVALSITIERAEIDGAPYVRAGVNAYPYTKMISILDEAGYHIEHEGEHQTPDMTRGIADIIGAIGSGVKDVDERVVKRIILPVFILFGLILIGGMVLVGLYIDRYDCPVCANPSDVFAPGSYGNVIEFDTQSPMDSMRRDGPE